MAETASLATFEKIPPPEIPKVWDFAQADKDFDKYIYKWRRLTIDVVSILWIFYNKLPRIEGRPKKTLPFGGVLPRWSNWLLNKGISENTPIRHFQALGWLPSDSLVGRLTGNIENYTPEDIIEKVKQVFGEIDLDPASCEYAQKIVKAKTYYTEKNDGLTKTWQGRVFLNPPYSMPQIRDFTDKLIAELPNIEAAILLTNDQTDTKWWRKCSENAQRHCTYFGRIHFYTPKGKRTSPTNGQTFFYYGKNTDKFRDVFSKIGSIWQKAL